MRKYNPILTSVGFTILAVLVILLFCSSPDGIGQAAPPSFLSPMLSPMLSPQASFVQDSLPPAPILFIRSSTTIDPAPSPDPYPEPTPEPDDIVWSYTTPCSTTFSFDFSTPETIYRSLYQVEQLVANGLYAYITTARAEYKPGPGYESVEWGSMRDLYCISDLRTSLHVELGRRGWSHLLFSGHASSIWINTDTPLPVAEDPAK